MTAKDFRNFIREKVYICMKALEIFPFPCEDNETSTKPV